MAIASTSIQVTVNVNLQHVSLPPSQWCSGFTEIFEWGSSDISSQVQLQVREAISATNQQIQSQSQSQSQNQSRTAIAIKLEPELESNSKSKSKLELEPEKSQRQEKKTKEMEEIKKDNDDANGLFFQPYKHGTIFAIPSVVPSSIGLAPVHPPNSNSPMQFLQKLLESVDTVTVHSLGPQKIGPNLQPPPAQILDNDTGVSLFKVVSYPVPPIHASHFQYLDSIPCLKFCFVDSRGQILFTTDLPSLMKDNYGNPAGYDILTGREYLGNFDYQSMFLNCSTHTYQYTVTAAVGVPEIMTVRGRLSKSGCGGGGACAGGDPMVKFTWSQWAMTTMGKLGKDTPKRDMENNNNNNGSSSNNNNNNKDGDNNHLTVATLKLTDQKILLLEFRKDLTFLYKIWIIVISWHIWARRMPYKI